jgi:hypothetical protein
MNYVIYQLVSPSHLQKKEMDGYYLRTITRSLLQELDVHGVEPVHPTMESAVEEIRKHSVVLKGMNLTVIPFIGIDYSGEIR